MSCLVEGKLEPDLKGTQWGDSSVIQVRTTGLLECSGVSRDRENYKNLREDWEVRLLRLVMVWNLEWDKLGRQVIGFLSR